MPDAPAPAAPRRRADAERSIAAILDAALICFGRSQDATMTEIAREAKVGRVTLYGHFNSREAILEALLDRSLAEIDAALGDLDLDSGPTGDALARLLHAPWLLSRYQGLYAAAVRHLGAEQVRGRHDAVIARLERLVERGQESGEFRADLPVGWLAGTLYALAHLAVVEVEEGRLPTEQAQDVLAATALGLLRPR